MSRSVFLSAAFLLAGCAAAGGFPSLAPRAIEGTDVGAEPAVAPFAPAVPDPATAAAAATARAAAEAGDRAFTALLAEARPALRAGGGARPSGDAWVAAQIALSRLYAARQPTADALDTLHGLRVARDDPALEAAWSRVAALDAAQAQALAEAAAALSRP